MRDRRHFLARSFEDMNRQLRHWLDTFANVRCHGTTGRVVTGHSRQEQPQLQLLLVGRFDAVLRIEQRVSYEGCVSAASCTSQMQAAKWICLRCSPAAHGHVGCRSDPKLAPRKVTLKQT